MICGNIIGVGAGELVGFKHPIYNSATLEFRKVVRRQPRHQAMNIGGFSRARSSQQLAVPDGVKIGGHAKEGNGNIVATTVVVVDTVEWLMGIRDEVDEKHKRFVPGGYPATIVSQYLLILGHCCNYAVVSWAISVCVVVGGIEGNIDIVPRTGFGACMAPEVGVVGDFH